MTEINCQVCKVNPSRYKCPKCVIKYCSLSCFQSHKQESGQDQPQSCEVRQSQLSKKPKETTKTKSEALDEEDEHFVKV